MRILSHIDCGVIPLHAVHGSVIRFDTTANRDILNVLVCDVPDVITVELAVAGKSGAFLAEQGLIVRIGDTDVTAVPLEKAGDNLFRAVITADGKDVRIMTRYPFGRDGLDRLICDTLGRNCCTWRFLQRGCRSVPMVQFGADDGKKRIHYIIAGEDAWETAGSLTAAAMIRKIAEDGWGDDSIIRIVPLVSPYSATTCCTSYCTPDGESIYGAATWGDDVPPPEFALLREMVERSIMENRAGLILTIHSWQAQFSHTGMETIRTAGKTILKDSRAAWADATMARLMDGVPFGKYGLADKIWHPGLARDYLLSRHNMISFRVEITTARNGHDGFIRTGECFARNIHGVADWQPVKG